jgi:hypothetical protein
MDWIKMQPTTATSVNHVNFNALFVRALKTFVQAFLAAVLAGLAAAISVPTSKALIVGAIAAGVFIAPQESK